MNRIAIIPIVLMSAHQLMVGQTLCSKSGIYNGHDYPLYLDWGTYTAEKLDTSIYVVNYDTSVMVDTLSGEKFNYNNVLLVGKDVNKFFSAGKFEYDLSRTKGGMNWDAIRNQHHVFFYEAIYLDRKTGQTTITERLCEDDFIYKEDTPVQYWLLLDEKKTIRGYECSLAECDFRGRHYYAWYTDEIPMSYGPWKLGGLPGLIVSAYDSHHHYEYTITELGSDSTPIFRINYNYVDIDRNRLNKLTNEILHRPLIYMDNHFHLTNSRRIRSDVMVKEGGNVYQYDAIERD